MGTCEKDHEAWRGSGTFWFTVSVGALVRIAEMGESRRLDLTPVGKRAVGK